MPAELPCRIDPHHSEIQRKAVRSGHPGPLGSGHNHNQVSCGGIKADVVDGRTFRWIWVGTGAAKVWWRVGVCRLVPVRNRWALVRVTAASLTFMGHPVRFRDTLRPTEGWICVSPLRNGTPHARADQSRPQLDPRRAREPPRPRGQLSDHRIGNCTHRRTPRIRWLATFHGPRRDVVPNG